MCSDLEHMLVIQRRYMMRQLHLRQLKTLEILPASKHHPVLNTFALLCNCRLSRHCLSYTYLSQLVS